MYYCKEEPWMSNEVANDYDKLKKALLTSYTFTEDGYRRRFRDVKPETEETPEQFDVQLKNYLATWLEFSGSNPGNFDDFLYFSSQRTVIYSCSDELTVYLLERGPKDLVELTT